MSRRGSKNGNFSARVSHIYSVSLTIERLQSKWARLAKTIEKNEEYLESLSEQIIYLEYKVTITPLIQKRNEILGWIDGKKQKIISVNESNNSIQSTIEEIKKKIIYYKNI